MTITTRIGDECYPCFWPSFQNHPEKLHAQCYFQALAFWVFLSFSVNASVTFLLEWPCILNLKYHSGIFNYNGLSETCIWQPPIILFFVLKLNMHSGLFFFFFFCSTLPKTLTVGSWQTPQMGSGCNWTFINHPLPRATKFLQPFLPSETFSSHWGMR